MRLCSKITFAGLIFTTTSVFAMDPAEGWYAGFLVGPTYAQSVSPNFSFNNVIMNNLVVPAGAQPRISYRIGGNIGMQLGYRCNNFRYEGELSLNQNQNSKTIIDGFTLHRLFDAAGNRAGGGTTTGAVFLNGYYEFYDEENRETHFVPYLGAGVGYTYVRATLDFDLKNTGPKASDKRTASISAAQGIIGFNYFFKPTVSLGTDLRYFSTHHIKSSHMRVAYGSWNILLNFSFDKPSN